MSLLLLAHDGNPSFFPGLDLGCWDLRCGQKSVLMVANRCIAGGISWVAFKALDFETPWRRDTIWLVFFQIGCKNPPTWVSVSCWMRVSDQITFDEWSNDFLCMERIFTMKPYTSRCWFPTSCLCPKTSRKRVSCLGFWAVFKTPGWLFWYKGMKILFN